MSRLVPVAVIVAIFVSSAPLGVGALVAMKTGEYPAGWIYTYLPGVGLVFSGMLGGAWIGRCALLASGGRRRMYAAGFLAQFSALSLVAYPLYLLGTALGGEAGGRSFPDLVAWMLGDAGLEGIATYAVYAGVISSLELMAVLCMVSLADERDQQAARKQVGAEVLATAADLRPSERSILAKIGEAWAAGEPLTTAELRKTAGYSEGTVAAAVKRLSELGRIVPQPGSYPERWTIAGGGP